MRLAGVLALVVGGLGCADILGIEKRSFGGGEACEATVDCDDGSFCVAGRCRATPPDSALCRVLAPEPQDNVSDFSFSSSSVVLGTMLLDGQSDDVPRVAAMQLAVEEMNRGVGLGEGRRAVMVGCDYSNGQDDLRAALDYLARDLGASVVIGATSSSNTEAAIGHIIGKHYATAFVSSFSTSPTLSSIADDDLLWRTAPNDLGQAKVLSNLVVADSDVSKLAIVFIKDSYGTGLQEEMNKLLDAAGRSASLHGFDANKDLDELAQEVADANPDGMLLIAVDPADVLAIYQAMVDAGVTVPHHYLADAAKAEPLLDDGLSPEVIAILESALGTAPYHSTAAHYATFAASLVDIGVDPNATSFLAQSYDAAYLAGYGLAYAAAAEPPFDGHRVVEGFMRVVPLEGQTAEEILVGPTGFPTAVTILTSDDPERRIDIRGTGGELDFDVTTGDAPGAYEIWQRDGNAFKTCGVCGADMDVCTISGC